MASNLSSDGSPPSGFQNVVAVARDWWVREAVGTIDQSAVVSSRREESELTARYLLLITMSAGIAILGLLLSSPAVVIGAMLLSPLMGPIIGLGFAISTGDFGWMRESARTLAIGTVLSIGFCALVVLFSPLQTITTEIAARTKPNLFDLLIALFSAIAGAYALIRGREGTIVGVAIATALMPPLAVVGFGLATTNWTVFSGALLLFVTNLMTIALTAAVMARIYGFRTNLSEKQTQYQSFMILAAFVALAIPLGISLRTIAWEANASRQINSLVMEGFDDRARLSSLETHFEGDPITVTATVLTPELSSTAESAAARILTRRLGQPVSVTLTQYRVGTSSQAAEEAQLTSALANQEADLQRSQQLAQRLALVAGVKPADVLVDRENRRAVVTARPLDGASLRAYRELENRIAATDKDWSINLIPPARALPGITFAEDALTPEGQSALDLIAWAQRRVKAPVVLAGPAEGVALASAALAERGVSVQSRPSGTGFGPVTASWAAPDSVAE